MNIRRFFYVGQFWPIGLLLLVFFVTGKIHAQQMIPGYIPTPNASDIGKYGDIPVSLYTGRHRVAIHILDMSTRGMDMNISLAYDPSGIMVNSLPGWTGHNWTLEAGGVIVRTMQGVWDEYNEDDPQFPYQGFLRKPDGIYSVMNNRDSVNILFTCHPFEISPDIFTFSFMGISGRFFYGNDSQWHVVSDQNIEVLFNPSDSINFINPIITGTPQSANAHPLKVIKGFILRDEKGYSYEFGGDNTAIDYSTDFFRQGEYDDTARLHATSWYLTKVRDKYGNILYELTYERGTYVAQFYNLYAEKYYNIQQEYGGEESVFDNHDFPYGGTLNAPVYLSSIRAANGIIADFVSSYSPITMEELYPNLDVFKSYEYDYQGFPFYFLQSDDPRYTPYQYGSTNIVKYTHPLLACRTKRLDEIRVRKEGETGFMRRISLEYDETGKTCLTAVRFLSGSGHPYMRYGLSYRNHHLLPRDCLTKAVDHWGYYNGHPYDTSIRQNFIHQRDPSIIHSQYGLLDEITYPTGGKTKFEYEQNTFSKCMSQDRLSIIDTIGYAGGVRIHHITDYADTDGIVVARRRTFRYTFPGTDLSSGELFATPRYAWNRWQAFPVENSSTVVVSEFRSASLIPLSNYFGPHIGYSCVEEAEDDGAFKRHWFQNISAAYDERFIYDLSGGLPSPYDMFSEKGYKRGCETLMERYDSCGSFVMSVSQRYRNDDVEHKYVLTSNLSVVPSPVGASSIYYTGGIYKLFFPKYDIIADTMVTAHGQHRIVETTSYLREDRDLSSTQPYPHMTNARVLRQSTKKRVTSGGAGLRPLTTEYYYPFDFNDSCHRSLWSSMHDLTPVQTRTYSGSVLREGEITSFRMADDGVTPIPDCRIRLNSNLTRDTLTYYLNYTPTFALASYIESGGPFTRIIWNNSDTRIEAIAEGTETTAPNGSVSLYIAQNPDMHVTRYGYLGLDYISGIIQPSNESMHFNYDWYGRLTDIEEGDNVIRTYKYYFPNK